MINFLQKHKQIVKYLIAGGTSAFVDLSLLYFFTDVLGVWYLISAGLAFVLAFFISFFLQKFWTFRDGDKEAMYKQMGAYLAVALINFVINIILMYVMVDGLKVWYMLAQFIVSGLIAVESYLVYKFFIFNRNSKSGNGKMRILIATGIYPPDIGGPATYAALLKKEFEKIGCQVKVIAYGNQPNNQTEQIYFIKKNRNIILRYFQYFIKVLALSSWANIIYTLDLISAGLPAAVVAKLNHKKIVFRTGGDFLWEKAFQKNWTEKPLFEYYKVDKNIKEKILIGFCRSILKLMSLVIFSTEIQADIYRRYYGLDKNKIRMVPNALPSYSYTATGNLKEEIIVFAGRIIKLKNLERLLKVFSRFKGGKLKLYIFGQGPEKDNLIKLAEKLNLGNSVEFHPNIDHGKLINFMAKSRFVILPSITEVSPNLALECLGMAIPIVLTKETGLARDIMGNFIVVDPMSEEDIKNKIEYLSDDANLAKYRRQLEDVKVEKREWSQVAGDHLEIFREIL